MMAAEHSNSVARVKDSSQPVLLSPPGAPLGLPAIRCLQAGGVYKLQPGKRENVHLRRDPQLSSLPLDGTPAPAASPLTTLAPVSAAKPVAHAPRQFTWGEEE